MFNQFSFWYKLNAVYQSMRYEAMHDGTEQGQQDVVSMYHMGCEL